jgi:autoinducer 2-degrading protein
MYGLSVTVHVRPKCLSAFIEATATQVRQTRQESGAIHYEVLQSEQNSAVFVIYEVYRSEQDFLFHRTAPHTELWKSAPEPILAQPRVAVRGRPLFSDGSDRTAFRRACIWPARLTLR